VSREPMRFPAFEAIVARRGIDRVAETTGVPPHLIADLIGGVWTGVDRALQMKIARALRQQVDVLFRPTPDVLARIEAECEAQGHRYRITDPAVLRSVERRP